MVRTAICAFTVQHIDETVHEVLRRTATAGYDGFQFSKRRLWGSSTPQEIRATLDETGLDVAPAHIKYGSLTDDEVLSQHEVLGIDEAVLAATPENQFVSACAVDELAAEVESIRKELEARNWELFYHNHDHEFESLEQETAYERFIKNTNVDIELDIAWALAGGTDPVRLIRRFSDRIGSLHIRDVVIEGDQARSVELGDGDVDLQACADAARDAGVDWFIYEHDPEDPVASIEHGATVLDSV